MRNPLSQRAGSWNYEPHELEEFVEARRQLAEPGLNYGTGKPAWKIDQTDRRIADLERMIMQLREVMLELIDMVASK